MHRLALAALTVLATARPAQSQLPELSYLADRTIDLPKHGIAHGAVVRAVRRDGSVIVGAPYTFGELRAFDSAGAPLPWKVPVGYRNDIGSVVRLGLAGDSVWIADPRFEQLVLLGRDGKIAWSIDWPTWVRPAWKDRRKYPLFSALEWQAVYGDGTMLVRPAAPRMLVDVPDYDRDLVYLVRIDRDGKILKTIARVPRQSSRLQLRDGTQRKTFNAPALPHMSWRTSADGERIAVVTSLGGPSDSGAFKVTMLTASGDTVYSRRYVLPTWRVSTQTVEKYLASIRPYGRHSAEWIRDTIRKMVPVFHSPVQRVEIGVDHSAWLWVRTPQTRDGQVDLFVLDARGEPAGIAHFPRTFSPGGLSVDYIWEIQAPQRRKASLVRMKRQPARAARPSRTAPASASRRQSSRPE